MNIKAKYIYGLLTGVLIITFAIIGVKWNHDHGSNKAVWIHDGLVRAQAPNYVFTLMKSGAIVSMDCEGPEGDIMIQNTDDESKVKILIKRNSGDYSYILDQNGDGLPDIGSLRGSNKKVKFSFAAVPVE